MKNTAQLRKSILARTASVAVIGQGYVGLSLACGAAEADFRVVGVDVDELRVNELRRGILNVPGVSAEVFASAYASERMTFSTDVTALDDADIIAICVPTPVRDNMPDLSHIVGAARAVATRLTAGRLVILESTTYPGTTDEVVRPILESSGLEAGRDFLLSYSPERIDPGNMEFDLRNTPRIVGGGTPEATGIAALFYGQMVDKVVPVSSCRTAELVKLLENTFRHINIALANEMAMVCHDVGIDVWEVVDAAATKPFGFMPFYPGPGVGGHCIPVDPAYLAWQVRRDAGRQFRILEAAQDINAQMPAYVAARISDALNDARKTVKGATILVLGVSYKRDVGDIRESPSIAILNLLHKRGAKVRFHDPYVESLQVNGLVLQRSELSRTAVTGADCVAILTAHSRYDLDWIAEHAHLVFDERNAFGSRHPGDRVVRL